MKRIIFLLTTIFICTIAYAETLNLTWGVDNETYYTSTCNVGDNITLPTEPTKYGYDFTGWQPIFYRGTFATWDNIPTNVGGYISDTFGSTTPNENDYIIVNDSSSVPEYGEDIIKMHLIQNGSGNGSYWSECHTYINLIDYGCSEYLYDGNIFVYSEHNNYYRMQVFHWRSDTKDVVCSGIKYEIGNDFYANQSGLKKNVTHFAKFINSYPYSGKWLLRYHGNWNDFNRGGWIAEKKLD